MAGASPLCFDVQALFGVAAAAAAASAPALPVNGSASAGGFVGGLNPASHHGISDGSSGRSLMAGTGTPSILYGPPAAATGSSRTGTGSLSASTFVQNGPTDLSIKKPTSNSSSTQHQNSIASSAGSELLHDVSTGARTGPRNQLNAAEIATVRQLIAGYRESAAFLYRSADELENLLLQHH